MDGWTLHSKPWCGYCDDERTRRIEDPDTGKIVGHCDCWTPRSAAKAAS
jgi:hypothetical protein